MNTYKIPLLLLLFNFAFVQSNEFSEKCCDADSFIVRKNGTYSCVKNVSKRWQLNGLNSVENDSRQNETKTCMDIYGNTVNKFTITSGAITLKEELKTEEFFPKCCPVGYSYNSTIHACFENNDTFDWMKKKLIKVGLPLCQIIVDFHVPTLDALIRNKDFIVVPETQEKFTNGNYCIDQTASGNYVVRGCQQDYEICKKIQCIHKCCPDGKSYVNGSRCKETYIYGLDLKSTNLIDQSTGSFAIIHGIYYNVYILREDRYVFHLRSNGVFSLFANKTNAFQEYEVESESYCFEHAFKEKILDDYAFFFTQRPKDVALKFSVTRWVKCISSFFLILTILVYSLLPELRNLFGKILISYCLATLIFFMSISFSQFNLQPSDFVCTTIGFVSIFGSICSFSWLNIMCIDIWITFGSATSMFGMQQRRRDMKRFLWYSLYGWGASLLLVSIILIFNKTEILPFMFHPHVGNYKCFIETRVGNYAYLLYIIFPLMLQQMVNLTLYYKTIRHCLKVKSEINKMNDTGTANSEKNMKLNAGRERMNLITKLGIIMGVSFIFEIASSFYDFQKTTFTSYIEVLWDTVNCLQGVFIFLIFICKKKVMYAIGLKFHIQQPRKISISSTTTTTQVSLNTYRGKRDITPPGNV